MKERVKIQGWNEVLSFNYFHVIYIYGYRNG